MTERLSQTRTKRVDFEWRFCLYRARLFQEDGDSLIFCPLHGDEFGLGWRSSKACKYSLHDRKQKPTRGVTKRLSEEVCQK